MYRRKKREFQQGTFIPGPARVCAIIQLCLAFTYVLWQVLQPFTGDIYRLKSELLYYHDLVGIPAGDRVSDERYERLMRNADRFQALPEPEQQQIIGQMEAIQHQLGRSSVEKASDIVKVFLWESTAFELMWVVLSIVLPILLLKRVEGAAQAIWVLPLLVVCYAVENRMIPMAHNHALFPSEEYLFKQYGKQNWSSDIFEQQKQLTQAWHRYLIVEWAKEIPSGEAEIASLQVEEGEFAFNLARLKQESLSSLKHWTVLRKPEWQVALYFFWNAFFAFTAWKHCRQQLATTVS